MHRFSKHKRLLIVSAAVALFSSCNSSGNRPQVEEPQPIKPKKSGPVDPQQSNEDPKGSTIASNNNANLSFTIDKTAFENYAIDLSNLLYTLDFKDEAGTTLVNIDKKPLEFDQATSKGAVKFKVKKGSTGFLNLRVEDNVDANDKFEGKSEKLTINADTLIKMSLSKIGDASLTINISFGDDPDTDPPTTGLASLPDNLQETAKNLGDPKTWTEPDLLQIQKVADVYCVSCHPSEAPGDTATSKFYEEKRVSEYLANKRMPYPGSILANDLNTMADAGFDYRAAMIRYAKSLGNNR